MSYKVSRLGGGADMSIFVAMVQTNNVAVIIHCSGLLVLLYIIKSTGR